MLAPEHDEQQCCWTKIHGVSTAVGAHLVHKRPCPTTGAPETRSILSRILRENACRHVHICLSCAHAICRGYVSFQCATRIPRDYSDRTHTCHSTVSVRHEVFTVPANMAPEGTKALQIQNCKTTKELMTSNTAEQTCTVSEFVTLN